MEQVSIIGIDTSKRSFQLHGSTAEGCPVFRKTLSRGKLLSFLTRQPPCEIVMEACGGSHYWGREIITLGHVCKLIPPIYVKPFLKRQKNDANDSEAIVEAAQRPTMRFVAVKTEEAQAGSMLFRTRDLLVRQRTQTINSVRGQLAEERSSRAWLWTSVSSDAVCFHIDPSRSAEAAHKLFGKALLGTVIVCDRYSAYKRLARLLGGLVTLAWCWSHMRRDFIDCAAGQVDLTDWCRGWIERIAGIYRLNEARLEHYDPGLKRPAPAFDAAQTALKEVLDALFAEAQRELAALPDEAREGKALRSLLNHRGGLSVFFDRPQVPMDNNKAERFLRGPSIGRRLSFGSDSEDGARFTAIMYSVVGTLSMNGIDVLRWLEAWLEACAKNGGQPPDDLSPWLPWSMSEERRREFMAPG